MGPGGTREILWLQSGIVEHICNPSTEVAEAIGWLQVQGHPGLHSKFQAGKGYRIGLSEREVGTEKS